MFKLGLTGSIATGKSTALKMFNSLGYISFSADDVVHRLYKNEAIPLVQEFCPQSISNNMVDRAILSAFLLEDSSRFKKLEALIHPLVKKQYLKFIQQAEVNNEKLVILDIPLLFESDNNYDVDAIAVTFCDPATQKQRALARQDMSEEKFAVILAKQLPQNMKMQQADFLIDSNKPLQDMQNQIVDIVKQCLQMSPAKKVE